MKKLLLGMLAIVAMIATSCQQEVDLGVNAGETATVSFNINAPASRAYSDGKTAQHLQWAVYDASGTYLPDLTGAKNFEISTTVELQLVTGNKYDVIFWAAAEDAPYTVKFDKKTMTVDYTGAHSNDEIRDAFYKKHHIDVKGAQTETIELRRPFAQLNIGTNDYEAAKSAGYEPTLSSVKVASIYNTLNLWDGTVSNTTDFNGEVAFAEYAIPTGETFPVAGYDYLAMNYLLVNEKENIDVVFTYTDAGAVDAEKTKTRTVGSVPVQRNYRTNLYGSILTSDVTINVEIKPEYNEPAHEAALQTAATVGGEITLTEDVALEGVLNVQRPLTINLNGHTLNGAFTKGGDGANAMIKNNVTLTIVGGTIKNTTENGDAAIYNTGNLVLDGVKIEGAPIGTTGYPEYAVYSVGGTVVVEEGTEIVTDRGVIRLENGADVTINGGSFVVNNNTTATLTSHVIYAKGSASKLTINGGDFAQNIDNGGGTSVICPAGATINIYGGNFYHVPVADFQSKIFQNYMGYGAPVDVYGGTYNDDSVTKSGNLAAGYKAVSAGGHYYVLPEVVADAATDENVTAVTESTADIATALATNNGEATMFLWNDVAYIAKYGEVVITSSADEATTVRGVVEGASGLTTATVAEGIEVVGNRTFRKCATLETVTLPNSLTEIGPAVFQSCSKLANVTIPASVATIGEGAFAECTSLTSINIPEAVTRLEKDVLRNTGLTSIEIPASVTYIGHYAFRDCESLTEVKILAPEFTMESDSFLNAAAPYPSMTIYVANAEMKAYVESKLGAHALTYTKVIVPNTVSTSTELQTALNNVSEGEVIVLSDNFTFTEGANGTTNGISVTGAENFVLDLNGNTVTSNLGGNALRFKIGEGNGITNQNVTVTIKNGKVVSGANNWCAISATGANGNKLTLNLENIEVENNKAGDYAIKAWTGATINAKNVNVTSNAGGSFYAVGGEIVLDGCSALTTSGSAAYMAAAIGISGNGKLTVNSGNYTATPSTANGQWVVYLMSSGGEFVVNGGTFNGTVASGNASYACGLICADTGAKVTLNGGTYNSNGAILDIRNNSGNASKQPSALLAGGNYSADPRVSGLYGSNLITVADGKTVVEANGIWTVE